MTVPFPTHSGTTKERLRAFIVGFVRYSVRTGVLSLADARAMLRELAEEDFTR